MKTAAYIAEGEEEYVCSCKVVYILIAKQQMFHSETIADC